MQPRVLAGRYVLGDVLGQGSMSVVWRARDLRLDRDVAVKMLAETSDTHTADIRAEARATAKVVHPHVAAIFDVAETELAPG